MEVEKMSKIEILGYSERGIINLLFYEILFSENNLQLINDFLSLVSFPYRKVNFSISDVTVLIEQSFSDFGNPDAVLLINNDGKKQVIFVEAKVKTSQKPYWKIYEEFEAFRTGIYGKMDSSNLFTQFYHKVRFIKALQNGGITMLKDGIPFPECSSKTVRKIGDNKVVLKAVDQLTEYSKDVLFIALVPDDISSLRDFYIDTLKDYNPEELEDWEVVNWGYISWAQVKEFCDKYFLKTTLKTFEFNEEQIY